METALEIVACTDKRNVMPTCVMMCSVCVNNPDLIIRFHIITDVDVADEDRDDIATVVAPYKNRARIEFYHITEQILDCSFPKLNEKITRPAYFRLFVAEMLPSTIDKVLYLDGDVIVRHSLKELWDMDLSNFALAAVSDMREGSTDRYEGFGYSNNQGYFNSGVLLINLAYWRQHQATKQFEEFIQKRYETIRFHDQDVLNYIFREQKKMIPIKYNLQDGFLCKTPEYDESRYGEEVIAARKDPVIVYFTWNSKPWKYSYSPNPFRSSFYKYQKLTKWKGVFIDERPYSVRVRNIFGNILRRMRILPQIGPRYMRIAPID